MPRDTILLQMSLSDFIVRLTAALDADGATPKDTVAALMRDTIDEIDLAPHLTSPVTEGGYSRNIVHTDPKGRFSVLAIEWLPGAMTPIHGHRAWGCVGVAEGTIGCDMFELVNEETHQVRLSDFIEAEKGAIAAVDPKPCGIHRLYNRGTKRAVTLHVYGIDLSTDPCCINVPYHF